MGCACRKRDGKECRCQKERTWMLRHPPTENEARQVGLHRVGAKHASLDAGSWQREGRRGTRAPSAHSEHRHKDLTLILV